MNSTPHNRRKFATGVAVLLFAPIIQGGDDLKFLTWDLRGSPEVKDISWPPAKTSAYWSSKGPIDFSAAIAEELIVEMRAQSVHCMRSGKKLKRVRILSYPCDEAEARALFIHHLHVLGFEGDPVKRFNTWKTSPNNSVAAIATLKKPRVSIEVHNSFVKEKPFSISLKLTW